jgi:transcriptional regulator with XRE-family HTH domain
MAQTFGERLRKLRLDRKMNQEQLAEKLGLDQSTISNYERNMKRPDFETLQKIASNFDVSLDFLTARTGVVYHTPGSGKAGHFYSQQQGRLMQEIGAQYETQHPITPEELKEKFNLLVDGRPATDEEIDEAVRYILIQRMMKEKDR